jgi:hypothetical protein
MRFWRLTVTLFVIAIYYLVDSVRVPDGKICRSIYQLLLVFVGKLSGGDERSKNPGCHAAHIPFALLKPEISFLDQVAAPDI